MLEYFHTDWEAMTANDWVGMILTVVIFLLMVYAYFQVFRPKNRDSLEARKHIPFDDDPEYEQDHDGRPNMKERESIGENDGGK